MKRLRNPAQECLSVLQSKQDERVFRVPARNNLSGILHCGTVLLENIPPLSPAPSEPPPRSKTLRIPLHSFVLATHGFSDSIPDLCELSEDEVWNEVTDVSPAPQMRWHPRRVVIDRSLLPEHLPEEEWLSSFTSFIHRLFDNPFVPVTTSRHTFDSATAIYAK
ncbi:hypothetical protein BLNAU_17538 [Blattamonas nauphoetae]|uniref:Uncharacterized protein n=1 Tax=Blattamonas nauphoetae TaxID=2049346 RepID=A0ABQ9X797_9EUKA|nr:hypothetical protein BLNAU_17538 [Blattamonas nauphoetae]